MPVIVFRSRSGLRVVRGLSVTSEGGRTEDLVKVRGKVGATDRDPGVGPRGVVRESRSEPIRRRSVRRSDDSGSLPPFNRPGPEGGSTGAFHWTFTKDSLHLTFPVVVFCRSPRNFFLRSPFGVWSRARSGPGDSFPDVPRSLGPSDRRSPPPGSGRPVLVGGLGPGRD